MDGWKEVDVGRYVGSVVICDMSQYAGFSVLQIASFLITGSGRSRVGNVRQAVRTNWNQSFYKIRNFDQRCPASFVERIDVLFPGLWRTGPLLPVRS
jgi:hypothetical protein